MCSLFGQYWNANNATKPSYRNQLSSLLSNNDMGGYGFYFAPNPFISSSYGPYLLIGYVAPKKSFPYYLGNDPAKVVQTVLTSADAVLYNWGAAWVLVARDYHTFVFSDNSTKVWFIDCTQKPDIFVNHKIAYKTFSPPAFIQNFRDIFQYTGSIPRVKPLKGGKDISDADLLKVIAWEWQINCNTTTLAIQKANAGFTGYNVAYALSSNSFTGQWPQLLTVLSYANYLPANSNITSGDYKTLQAAVVKQYRAIGGAKIVAQFFVGFWATMSWDPRIETWYKHPHLSDA